MGKKSCREGEKFDNLVDTCVSSKSLMKANPDPPKEPPLTIVNQLKAINTTVKPHSMVVLSPTLWISVVLVVVGSILALTVWFIIYKRQTRRSSRIPEDGMPRQELLQKVQPPAKLHPLPSERNGQAEIFQRATEAPSPCSHMHSGSQTGSQWENGFTACRDLVMRAGTEVGGGSPACSTMAEHRIPLPATELGGTALVTTKTM